MEITPATIKRVARDVADMHRKSGAAVVLVGERKPGETVMVNMSREPVFVPRVDLGQKTVTRMFWAVRQSKLVKEGEKTLAVWSMLDVDGEFGRKEKGASYAGIGVVVNEERARRLNRRYPDTAFLVPVEWDFAP